VNQTNRLLLIPSLIGAALAVALGAYGSLHTPTRVNATIPVFSSLFTAKLWFASAAALFALVQLLSALAMWGKLGSKTPSWTPALHRWSGRIAFLLAVPVASQCLYALGFSTFDTRALVHSILGCLFFGVFTVKMLALPKQGLAGWVLPVLGGLVFTLLIGLWLTSSFWYFTTIGVKL
jgi:hypothetical protein